MINLLAPGHLLNPLPAKQTRTASHQIACLILDEHDNEVHAHIKAFPSTSKALANEIAGHLLHHAAGVDTAPRAWIIILTAAELNALFPAAHWGDDPERLRPCWASEHIPGTPINAAHAWSWQQDLAAWNGTPIAISLHEWLWAIDGNEGNLIATDVAAFAAIDHADILGGERWTGKKLLANIDTRFYNKALHIAWSGLPTLQQRLAAHESAARHGHILAVTWPHIAHWWQHLIKKKDIEAALRFLEARSGPDWMTKRI